MLIVRAMVVLLVQLPVSLSSKDENKIGLSLISELF